MNGNNKKLTLGILPSLGGSIESQRIDRREGLFLNYYIPSYLTAFDEVRYFSYANENQMVTERVRLFPNRWHIHKYFYAFLVPFIYRKAIRECHLFRVMHLNGAVPAILAKMLYKIPFATTYGYNYVKFAEIEGHPIKAKFLKFLVPIFLRRANHIIVTTPDLRKEVEDWIGKTDKVTLIPNGVDTIKFVPNEKQELFPFFRLLTIGRLEKQKNLFFLLEVISKLKSKREVKLTIIGKGSLSESLKKKVFQENLPVRFISHIPYESIVGHHREADCYISTSLAEGHPKALIEAMSSGLACVVSHCPGNSMVVESGKTGFLLKLDDINVWVDILLELSDVTERRRSFGRNARQWVIQNFDINHTLANEINLLLRMARTKLHDQQMKIKFNH